MAFILIKYNFTLLITSEVPTPPKREGTSEYYLAYLPCLEICKSCTPDVCR